MQTTIRDSGGGASGRKVGINNIELCMRVAMGMCMRMGMHFDMQLDRFKH